MVVKSADEAINNANRYTTCEPGQCLKYVRTWLEIGSQQASAADAWHAAKHKHPGDRNPPRGAPVFWTGGSKGYGHIGLAKQGNSQDQAFRGTDMPSSGHVSNQQLEWVEQHWTSETYMGWTEDLNGVEIPYLSGTSGTGDWRASGDVYVNKLKQGTKNSDSVSRLRYRLTNHQQIPDDKKPGYGDDYGDKVVEAVKWWQRHNGWEDGKGVDMGNNQANKLFGENYNVIEE